MKVLSLSRAALSGVDVREVALPIMRQLVDQIHITTHLAILDHGEAVYVEKVEAPSFIKMDTWVGRRMEVHSTAVGKALLAYLDAEERNTILHQRGLKKLTHHTIITLPRLMKEFERVRQLGYAIDDEENSLGARCVGAPIFNGQGSGGGRRLYRNHQRCAARGGTAYRRHGERSRPPHLAPDWLSWTVSAGGSVGILPLLFESAERVDPAFRLAFKSPQHYKAWATAVIFNACSGPSDLVLHSVRRAEAPLYPYSPDYTYSETALVANCYWRRHLRCEGEGSLIYSQKPTIANDIAAK